MGMKCMPLCVIRKMQYGGHQT